MALEDIFKALEEQGERDSEDIIADSRDRAEAIVADAEEQAETIRRNKVAEAERLTRARAAQKLNTVRLDGKKRTAATKEAAVSAAFDAAAQRLTQIRNSGEYDRIFAATLEEALEGMQGEVEILVDKADVARAERELARLGVTAPVSDGLETAGGVVATTQGGRIMRRNTVEERLEKVRQADQAEVAGILFS